jgi:hypothetical protein
MTLSNSLAAALGLGAARGSKALARATARLGKGRRVVALSEPIARALEAEGQEAVRAAFTDGRLTLADGHGDALCGSGLPEADVAGALTMLRECARVVKHGGLVLVATGSGLTGRGAERSLVTALLLHAGLEDLEQRLQRGSAISSGRVRRP